MSAGMQFAGEVFRGVLEASLHASLLAVAAGVLLWVLRERVSPRVKHAAWMLVAARLCLPAGLAVPVGPTLQGLRGEPAPANVTVFRTQGDGVAATSAAPPPGTSPAPAALSSHTAGSRLRLEDFLALVWLAGCAFFGTRLLWRASADHRRLRSLLPASDGRLDGALAACARELGVRRPPLILTGAVVAVPSLAGVFRPRLLVPPDRLERCSEEELRHVFLHELAHFKRRDVAWNWILAVLETIHWWNPVVRWAFRRAREERELACDAVALRHSGEGDSGAYASTLIRLVESASLARSPVAALGLGGRRFIERRIRWIARWGDRRCSPVLAGLVLAGLATGGVCCTTKTGSGAGLEVRTYEVEDLLEPPPESSARDVGWLEQDPKPEDPEETRRRKRRSLENLAEQVRSRVSPEAWKGHTWIDLEENALRVTAPGEVQEGVKRFLHRKLAEKGLVVTIDFRLLALDSEAMAKLPPETAKHLEALLRGEKLPARMLGVGELQKIEGAGRAEYQPTITALNGQRASIRVAREESLIVDLQPSEVEGKKVFEPVSRVLSTGFSVASRAELSEDRKRVALELKPTWVDVNRPIQSVVVEGCPIAVPEMTMCQSLFSLDAPVGEWHLAAAFVPRIPDNHTRLFLVKADLVPPPDSDGGNGKAERKEGE